MSLLEFAPAGVEVTYNGFTFNASLVSRHSIRPVYDDANRGVMYKEFSTTFEFILRSDDPADFAGNGHRVDVAFEPARRALLNPAGELIIKGKGLGLTADGIHLNKPGGGGVRDAKWGPHPGPLEIKKDLGNANAFACKWSVVYRIPCDDADARNKGIIGLTWGLTWARELSGLFTIRTTGKLTIQVTRSKVDSRKVPDLAESYRDTLRARDVMEGYDREEDHTLSPDGTELSFQWTDRQLSMPKPPDVAEWEWEDTFDNVPSPSKTGGPGFVSNLRFNVGVSGWVMMHHGVPDERALAVINDLVNDRMKKLRDGHALANPPALAAPLIGALIAAGALRGETFQMWMTRQRISATGAGRAGRHHRTRFDYSYHVVRTAGLQTMIEESNLWRPVAGTSYATSRQSIANIRAKLSRPTLDPSEVTIIDPCPGGQTPFSRTQSTLRSSNGRPDAKKAGELVPRTGGFSFWDCELLWEEDLNVVRHKPLELIPTEVPGNPPQRILSGGLTTGTPSGVPSSPASTTAAPFTSAANAAGSADALRTTTGSPGFSLFQGNMPADRFQRTAAPTRTVWLIGAAERFNAEVPVPELKSFGGIEVTELQRLGCVPMRQRVAENTVRHSTWWSIEYAVGSAPARIGGGDLLADPLQNLDGRRV